MVLEWGRDIWVVLVIVFSAIPAGASRNGVLSEPCPLIGESSVKDAGVLDGSDEEYSGNSTSAPLSTRSDLVGCNPAGIAVVFLAFVGIPILHLIFPSLLFKRKKKRIAADIKNRLKIEPVGNMEFPGLGGKKLINLSFGFVSLGFTVFFSP